MPGLLRKSLSQSLTPGTAVLAAFVAAAAVTAGLLAELIAGPVYAAVRPASILFFAPLVVDAVVSAAVWIPVASFVLAGFYGSLGEAPEGATDSLRAFARYGRAYYRRYLVGATAGFAASIALTIAVWVVFVVGYLATSTGFDYLRYADGARFAANPLWSVAATAVLLALAGLVATAVFVFTGPLLVRSDVDPWRAPLASVRMLRASPRVAVPTATGAALLFALPEVATWVTYMTLSGADATLTGDHPLPTLSGTAETVLAAFAVTFLAYLLAGPLLVSVTDRQATSIATPSLEALKPGRRVATLALVVLLVGSAATGVRVADVRPHNPPEPGVDLAQSPDDVYADSLDLTRQTSRRVNVSVLTYYSNGTLEQRVSFVTAWDASDAQTRIGVEFPEKAPSEAYFSQQVTAFQLPESPLGEVTNSRYPVTRRTNGWLVATVPMHGLATRPEHVGPRKSFRRDDIPLRVVERTPNRLVLGVDGDAAAALSPFHGADRYDVRNASFRAFVDPKTGYLRRIRLTTTVLERAENGTVVQRRSHERVVKYDAVGETDVERPAIGDPTALEYLWDVLWY